MNLRTNATFAAKALTALAFLGVSLTTSAVTWPNKPLNATARAKPMTMLVASKDHKFFYEAYNDASDINGDGRLDRRFTPTITYYGLYDSTLCYGYTGTGAAAYFEPRSTADNLGRCLTGGTSGEWSGNWLNYVTTSRIDALRKVLYGGHRDVDSTTRTILRRAYIPQDAHSWAKEYQSVANDGYNIADYTALALPIGTTYRHFFGNLTANRSVNCTTLNTCSNLPPLLRVRQNVQNARVWQWASKERPVLDSSLSTGGFNTDSIQTDYTVRAEVCTATFNAGCKRYPNGQFKPIGLLHEYGENDSMLFGLLSGSYDRHFSGGRLRKVVSSFSNEVTASTGVFASNARIVNTFNNLRIRGFNQSSDSSEYRQSNPYALSALAPTEGEFVDWGNPMGEMLFEATRYFAGRSSPTSAFMGTTTRDTEVGLSSVTWDDPYDTVNSAARAPVCSRPNFLAISDINPSFDSDQIPGSTFNTFSSDLTGLNITTRGATITAVESGITGRQFFIGQSGTGTGSYDAAPTPKIVSSLGTIRGLAPEEPTKQGSYSAAAMAYYAKSTDLRPTLTGTQSVDTYVVALSSPLPRIEVKVSPTRSITLVPFSKSVSGSGISNVKGNYQPTNQIVDFYVESIANSNTDLTDPTNDYNASVNSGRYEAVFQINYEDVEQGGDHDMDAIARYVVRQNANGSVSVDVTPTYQAGGIQQNMGYVISGSTQDGVYLVARDETVSPRYFLNVPAGRTPGYCDRTDAFFTSNPAIALECRNLPTLNQTASFTFTASSSNTGASLLKDPLWYAAKWGGFRERNANQQPDQTIEWDEDGNGVPDTYFLVQNPLRLKESLQKAFTNIVNTSASGGNAIANSTALNENSLVYQATYDSSNWSGNLSAFPVTNSGLQPIAAWNAASLIPTETSRRIFFWNSAVSGGSEFQYASLTSAQRALFNNSEEYFRYFRGKRDLEIARAVPPAVNTLRDRAPGTVLGDIAHSSPVFSRESETLFVGANDGMLHAFNSVTGVERFAYIPGAVFPTATEPGIKVLADPAYNENHRYFVDGEIAVTNRNQVDNKNFLVATLGRGGKGLFGLDVTDPNAFDGSKVLWELASTTDTELGNMIGKPVIAQLDSGAWVVIVGNGYNSTSGTAALYVIDLRTGTVLRKIDTGFTGDNGLATPGLFDADGDGRVDTAYAGDLYGNVWKFDLSHETDALQWGVAFSGQPFFRARDSLNNFQPITAEVSVIRNFVTSDANYGAVYVHFGTGSYFKTGDSVDTSVQSWYGLIDAGTRITSRTNLVARTVSTPELFGGLQVRVFGAATAGDMTGRAGFYVDLSVPGERIVTATRVFVRNQPVLIASTNIPEDDECSPGGRGFVNAINPFTGARLSRPFFDINRSNDFLDDTINGAYIGSFDLNIGTPSENLFVGNFLITGASGGLGGTRTASPLTPIRGRLTWREIVRD